MKNKKYLDGIYSKKQNTTMILLHLLYLGMIPYLVSAFYYQRSCLIYEAFGYVLLSFVIIMVTSYFISPGFRLIHKYKKTGNCKEFIEGLDKLKTMSDKINDETLIYIEMLRVNVYFLYDASKAQELFLKLKKPTHKYYFGIYQRLEIDYLISIDSLEEGRKKVSENKSKNPVLDRYVIALNVKDPSYVEDDIEYIIKTNIKNKKIDSINNISYLMTYFSLRNDDEKAKKYAQMALDLNTDCNEINSKAKTILGI